MKIFKAQAGTYKQDVFGSIFAHAKNSTKNINYAQRKQTSLGGQFHAGESTLHLTAFHTMTFTLWGELVCVKSWFSF